MKQAELIHRLQDGGSISVDGERVVLCLPSGPGGLPMAVSFSGEAVAALMVAATKAFQSRRKGRRDRARQSSDAMRALARMRKVANG